MHVNPKVLGSSQTDPTLWAGMRTLSGVNLHMSLKMSTLSETFATFTTVIRVLIVVDAQKAGQGSIVTEAFTTCWAGKRHLPSMDEFMAL